MITHSDDAAGAAKLAVDFAKDCDKLVVKGGILRQDVLDEAKVKYLAKLPGREQLQSEFVGLINSLVGTVYFNAQDLLSEFTGLCDAQKEKLEAA